MSPLGRGTAQVGVRYRRPLRYLCASPHRQSRRRVYPNVRVPISVFLLRSVWRLWLRILFVRFHSVTTKVHGNSKSMQNLWGFVRFCMRGRRTWAGVMRHHAPSLRGTLIHIGGHDHGFLCAIGGQQCNALNHIVHGTGE